MLTAQEARRRMACDTYMSAMLDNIKTSIENSIASGLNHATFLGGQDLVKNITVRLIDYGYQVEQMTFSGDETLIAIRW